MNPEQTCGNCKWWAGLDKPTSIGPCGWPQPRTVILPLSILDNGNGRKWMTFATTGCPCWEAKP